MWKLSFQIPPWWVWKWDIFHCLWEVASPPHPNFSTVPQRSMVSFSPSLHSFLSPQFSWTSHCPTTTHSWRTSGSSSPTAYDLLLKISLLLCIVSYPVSLALHYNVWKFWRSAAMQHYVGGNRLDICRKHTVFFTSMYCLCPHIVSRYHLITFFFMPLWANTTVKHEQYGQGTGSTAKEKIQRVNSFKDITNVMFSPLPPLPQVPQQPWDDEGRGRKHLVSCSPPLCPSEGAFGGLCCAPLEEKLRYPLL